MNCRPNEIKDLLWSSIKLMNLFKFLNFENYQLNTSYHSLVDVQRDKCIIITNNRQYWQSGTTLPSVQQCVNLYLSDTTAVTLYRFSNSWFVKKTFGILQAFSESYGVKIGRCFIRHSVIYVS